MPAPPADLPLPLALPRPSTDRGSSRHNAIETRTLIVPLVLPVEDSALRSRAFERIGAVVAAMPSLDDTVEPASARQHVDLVGVHILRLFQFSRRARLH